MERIEMNQEEPRKYPRINIFCPITYACLDSDGGVVKERMAVGIGISQKDIIIESTSIITSEYILLSYVDLTSKLIEIRGKIGCCKKSENSKYRAEISFQGPQEKNIAFIKKIIKAHRIRTNSYQQ
jgi:hypothetical protein